MNIAYTMAPGPGDTDLLLFDLAQRLQASGLRPGGIVQINTERCDAGPCDMDVKVLPDGPVIRISQNLGRNAKGCRLDPAALETAVGHVQTTLSDGVDCLIINKFGKHEASGRGFRPLIAEALSNDIPVLVGLNQLNAGAFVEFTQGIAVQLAPDAPVLADWVCQAASATQSAA